MAPKSARFEWVSGRPASCARGRYASTARGRRGGSCVACCSRCATAERVLQHWCAFRSATPAFVLASMNPTGRGNPLCSVPTTRWLPARLWPTHAVRMVRANARVSPRIGHRVLPQWRVSRCVRSRSPTSWRYGAIHQDVSCTSCTARPPPPRAVTAHSAQKRSELLVTISSSGKRAQGRSAL